MSEEILNQKLERYGLSQPLPLQYIYWLKNIITGNFGESVKYKIAVSSLVGKSLPVTLGLVVISFIFSQIIAILLGVLSAVYKGRLIDRVITIMTILFFSIPVFFLSLVFVVIISKYLHRSSQYAATTIDKE